MNEQESVLVGKVGLGISLILWVLCTWRLGFHLCGRCFGRSHHERDSDRSEPIEQQQQRQLPFFTRRRAFHGLLWIATVCDFTSYAFLSGIHQLTYDRTLAECIAYFLLNIGRAFELLAFCIATEIWLRTAIDARPQSIHSVIENLKLWLDWSTCVFLFCTMFLVLISVALLVGDVCRLSRPTGEKFEWAKPLLKFQTIVEAACWGFQMLIVSLVIFLTFKSVLVLVPSSEWKRRLLLLSKTIGPMFVSFLAYGTRCGWLVAAYMNHNRRDSWAWWISFVWLPTATVAVVLLYSTRKRDYCIEETVTFANDTGDSNVGGDTNNDLQESLLRPQPPEEAFRAFHIFRHGNEDADDSFSLGSPIPRDASQQAAGDDLQILCKTKAQRS